MRSFDLSHEYFFNHQKEIELKERQVVYLKEKKLYDKAKEIERSGKQCESIVLTEMANSGIQNARIEEAEVCHFASKKCVSVKLVDFIKLRSWENISSGTTYGKFPNKMKLSDALQGQDCLIKRAFDVRKMPLIFKCPEEPREPELDASSE